MLKLSLSRKKRLFSLIYSGQMEEAGQQIDRLSESQTWEFIDYLVGELRITADQFEMTVAKFMARQSTKH